jgi:hypothetical protein
VTFDVPLSLLLLLTVVEKQVKLMIPFSHQMGEILKDYDFYHFL